MYDFINYELGERFKSQSHIHSMILDLTETLENHKPYPCDDGWVYVVRNQKGTYIRWTKNISTYTEQKAYILKLSHSNEIRVVLKYENYDRIYPLSDHELSSNIYMILSELKSIHNREKITIFSFVKNLLFNS